MPEIPWRTLTERGGRRPFRLPVALSWRVERAREIVARSVSVGVIHAASRVRALRGLPRWAVMWAERHLIRASGPKVFDPDFYLDRNPDVRDAGKDSLEHYLTYGWREARVPNPRFDDAYYRAEAGLAPKTPVSALAHFLAIGQRAGLAPAPDVDLGGWQQRNPDIAVARVDAYGHFLDREHQTKTITGPPTVPASLARLDRLTVNRNSPALVDVVMPVFLGRAETLNAIACVLEASGRTGFELIVIDDDTPDQDLASDLDDLAARGLINLVRQSGNRGFVAAINRGMACNIDRDVVWLNADTEVYDFWLDRLREAAYSAARVATVTPFSNNATICSYPRLDADNATDLECGWAEVDRIAARTNLGERVVAPTAVGFCTYVRRDAIKAIGSLDEETFGRGYGEENDFSRRAISIGWVNLVATDVVVRHFGGVSFGAERAGLIEHALAVLDRRYPDYHGAVHRFLAEDPLQPARHALDLARLRALRGERNILIVTHSRGGGTEQHVSEEIERFTQEGASVFVMSRGSTGFDTVRLRHVRAGPLPTLEAMPLGHGRLWAILATLNLSEVRIHHLIDFPVTAPALFREHFQAMGVRYSFTMHDYFAVCPRINMADLGGMYCGEPDAAGCRACLLRRGSAAGRPDVLEWRARYRALFNGAFEVNVPDPDVADRLHGHFPELRNVQIRPHEAPVLAHRLEVARREPGPLRVAVIGAIGPIKGVDVLFATALRAQRRMDGPKFTVIGYTHNDRAARACGISVTGAYDNAEVDLLIERADPDVIWIPSTWPETYCYTLSIALRSGRPVAGFAIGAIATRLRAAGHGHLIPLSDASKPARLLEALAIAAEADRFEGVAEVA
ncbi:MAG: glycosyltransferase [Pseudomonadota bacterium]